MRLDPTVTFFDSEDRSVTKGGGLPYLCRLTPPLIRKRIAVYDGSYVTLASEFNTQYLGIVSGLDGGTAIIDIFGIAEVECFGEKPKIGDRVASGANGFGVKATALTPSVGVVIYDVGGTNVVGVRIDQTPLTAGGGGGGGNANVYSFPITNQTSPFIVNHNLGHYPLVQVINDDEEIVAVNVTHVSMDSLSIDWELPLVITGFVLLV